MNQRGRGRGADKTLQTLRSLNVDFAKYRTFHSQEGGKNTQEHKTQNTTIQRHTAPLQQHLQSPALSSLHASSSSFSSAHKHMPPPSASVHHTLISSHSPLPGTKFTGNIHPPSKSSPQHKQTSHSLSSATKSFTQNSHPLSKPHSSPQHKHTLSQPLPSTGQRNRLSPARPGYEKEWMKDREPSSIIRSVQMIMTQLQRMEERQISIEKKIDENTRAITQLTRNSAIRRPMKPQEILFRTVDDFVAFEDVDEDVYNDLVGYFIYLGRTNPVDCAAEYFRSVFPEDEEVSPYLTLNGKTGPGGCKLRNSRFAQACQDAINANKYFTNLNNVEFYDALEKALKSLKTRKWRYNRKRKAPLQREENEENEEVPPNQRQRIDDLEEDTGIENIQEEIEDTGTIEESEIQDTEEENADDIDTQDTEETENNDEQEYSTTDDLYDDDIVLFGSP
ncbi:uncharacterized protein LOC120357540 [Solenopsis invicta]|uniref:uncharacterized protein LOC120357540 n=1 Tax=Solenopsis invicta TaxID=13686 RepID=UPI00193D824A|nr:uncharacterized protein LOC120357540 [Solenopsis invicta]